MQASWTDDRTLMRLVIGLVFLVTVGLMLLLNRMERANRDRQERRRTRQWNKPRA